MTVQVDRQVNIKGIRTGLLVTLGDGPYAEILQQLTAELTQKQAFLQGSHITLQVGPRQLQRRQLVEIKAQFEQHGLSLWTILAEVESTKAAARGLGLATRLPGSPTDLDGNALPENDTIKIAASPSHRATKANMTAAVPGTTALLLKETIRSGRSVYYEGHVVVIGDVNPGAEIIAGGDVVVWGRLRGFVHAGALGDETAVICTLDLSPTQLRIADLIAISPETRQQNPHPEQVAIRAGQIVAEPWQTKS